MSSSQALGTQLFLLNNAPWHLLACQAKLLGYRGQTKPRGRGTQKWRSDIEWNEGPQISAGLLCGTALPSDPICFRSCPLPFSPVSKQEPKIHKHASWELFRAHTEEKRCLIQPKTPPGSFFAVPYSAPQYLCGVSKHHPAALHVGLILGSFLRLGDSPM